MKRYSFIRAIARISILMSMIFNTTSVVEWSNTPELNYRAVLKIKTYSKDPISWNFTFSHYGSAVFVGNNTIITNAHVILDGDTNKPTWYYEVCQSQSVKEVPICFSTATIESYDEVTDIAKLKLNKASWIEPLMIKEVWDIIIGEKITVFWYPGIGGKTITRTEWTIGGIDTDDLYKFDGTLDYWNSGWAALNSKWELIWIPRAIKSDNGVIWYIIPIKAVKEFLNNTTTNIPKGVDMSGFDKYIRFIQSWYGKNIIKDPKVEINNITKNWFRLTNKIGGLSGSTVYYQFADKTERTIVIVSCWTESFTTWGDSIEAYQKFMEIAETKNNNIEVVKKEFIDKEKTIYTIERVDKVDKEWNSGVLKVYTYKNNPTCWAYIMSIDWTKKDKTSYINAKKIVDSIKFKKTWIITKDFRSTFFSMKNVPNNTSISEWYRFLYWYWVYPEITVLFPWNKWYASSEFEVITFNTVDDYMNYGYSSSNTYNGKSYTFQDFFNRYKTTGYTNVQDYELNTNEQKKIIVTIEDYTDSLRYPGNPTQKVIFFYPFSLWEWRFYAYKFEFTLYSNDRQDAYSLLDIIKRVELPWVSPFR